jgi:dTDP-glucose 4,6-dehydratase
MLHVLEYAREVEPQALVHISTDEVFGPANSGVKYQEWDRQLPSNPYSCSKSCQEMICVAHWRTYGVPVIIVPLMNSFGEGQNKEKFIPTIVRSLLSRKNIPVHAEKIVDGSWRAGSRTWLHAANQADALKTIILRSERLIDIHRFPEGDRPFKVNVGGDKEMDNLAVVRLIGEILGIEPKIDFQDIHSQRPGHDRRYALDSSVIKNLFGWTPPIPLEESFRRTVKWMADNKEKWL